MAKAAKITIVEVQSVNSCYRLNFVLLGQTVAFMHSTETLDELLSSLFNSKQFIGHIRATVVFV